MIACTHCSQTGVNPQPAWVLFIDTQEGRRYFAGSEREVRLVNKEEAHKFDDQRSAEFCHELVDPEIWRELGLVAWGSAPVPRVCIVCHGDKEYCDCDECQCFGHRACDCPGDPADI